MCQKFAGLSTLLKGSLLGIQLILLASCSSMIERMAVGTTAKLLFKASADIETETNWDHFKNGVPSHLKLIEGLLSLQPDNEELLVSAIKGYAGYAYAVDETLYLNDYYQDISSDESKSYAQANINYAKAMGFAQRYFSVKGIDYGKLLAASGEQGKIDSMLDNRLDAERLMDQEAILYTAQSLGSLINLNRDKMSLVAQLPLVNSMFNWVCDRNPKINFGACRIFAGSLQAGRPKALGGNPAEGKSIFLRAIRDYPNNWLIHVNYLQFYVIPMSDENEYRKVSKVLSKARARFLQEQSFVHDRGKSTIGQNKRIRLYQSIALKRFEIMKKHEQEYF